MQHFYANKVIPKTQLAQPEKLFGPLPLEKNAYFII